MNADRSRLARPGTQHAMHGGRPWPMGATFTGEGVNFAVFSAHAERIEICLFDPAGHETQRLTLPDRTGDIWFGQIPGLGIGARYGLRAHGPTRPEFGHRFNPAKLLIDPYARELTGPIRWSELQLGYHAGAPAEDLTLDARDSAPTVPKCVVTDPALEGGATARPDRPVADTLIYEAHVKGMTALHPGVEPDLRGTFVGFASDPVIDHLTALGVTAVELMPVQAFIDDRHLVQRGLTNYWGYQPIALLAPEPRYAGRRGMAGFQAMVHTLHRAGIEVILDVVLNHTGEGNEFGPTLGYRGLDNRSYYRLAGAGRRQIDDTGTGNTLDLTHPMVLRLVMDALRHWANTGVDGFRFDLATTLAREAHGFDANGGFLRAVAQDPLLSRLKLIAEPWDIGPGGYQLGRWPHPFMEWNDRFRDGVRRFWRGDEDMTAELARRLTGSAELFERQGRATFASVNYVTAHDGFTLQDLVSYEQRHNEANGEANHDGHGANFSANLGQEGPSDDPAIRAARTARKRVLLATLMLAQGTPMLLAGDEIGRSQQGNNNAYAHDSRLTWLDWDAADHDLLAFVQRLARLRRDQPLLRQAAFLHGRQRQSDDAPDLHWRKPDGSSPAVTDWHDPTWRTLCAEIRGAPGSRELPGALFLIFNAGGGCPVTLPDGGRAWHLLLDTAAPAQEDAAPLRGVVNVGAGSVMAFTEATAKDQ